jgi:hypothetical protein
VGHFKGRDCGQLRQEVHFHPQTSTEGQTMTIDNTPSIRAFVEERIKLAAKNEFTVRRDAVTDELKLILTLCDGLTKQNELLTKALKV